MYTICIISIYCTNKSCMYILSFVHFNYPDKVSVNFGPNFKFLPPVSNCKPVSDQLEYFKGDACSMHIICILCHYFQVSSCGVKMAVEQTMAEMLFHVTRRPLLDR